MKREIRVIRDNGKFSGSSRDFNEIVGSDDVSGSSDSRKREILINRKLDVLTVVRIEG